MENNNNNNVNENINENIEEKTPKKEHKKEHKNNEEIIHLQEELALTQEKCMRIQAEMMNFKRRKEEEVVSIRKYANEDILSSLLNVIDNFERALKLENEDNKEFLKGFNMIYANILNILNENGVVEIDCLNKPFDPNYHQAVLTDHVDGVDEGIVIEVLQKGYMYKDRVLRPSMVKVSN